MQSLRGDRWRGSGWVQPRPILLAVLGPWLLACAMLLYFSASHIAALNMWDTDDYMRLQQVRDWLGGQSWFDVDQYRLDPPHGFHMHWSRIVDLPLAGIILLLRPITGTAMAETTAAVLVPLVTLCVIMALVALVARRVAGDRPAMLAPLLVACCPLILFHTLPLRIDHHGWQAAMAMATLATLLDRSAARGGLLAGLCAAVWISISLEAFPLVVTIYGLLVVRFLIDPRHGARLHGFAVALAAGCAALFVAMHAPARWGEPDCDAISINYLGLLAGVSIASIVATGPLAARHLPGPHALSRGVLIALGAGAGALFFAHAAPACLAGPFGALDPITRQYWYMNVLEGRPVWVQDMGIRGMLLLTPAIGLTGYLVGWYRVRHDDAAAARDWMTMIVVGLAAMAVSMLVQRAGSVAAGFTLPGVAALLAAILGRVASWPRMLLRVVGSSAAILGMTPVAAAAIGGIWSPDTPHEAPVPKIAPGCLGGCDRYGALDRIPAAYIFAPIDVSPSLIVHTPHRFPAGGYHRNPPALRRTIETFLGSADAAHRVIDRVGATYVLIDPEGAETQTYRRASPRGFMAQLASGHAPAWLEPVALPGSALKLWRTRG